MGIMRNWIKTGENRFATDLSELIRDSDGSFLVPGGHLVTLSSFRIVRDLEGETLAWELTIDDNTYTVFND